MARILALLLAVILILAGCGGSTSRNNPDPDELVIRVIPTQAENKLGTAFEKLGAHLEKDLGKKVRIDVAPDYAAVVEAMKVGKGDIALLGPYTYVVVNAHSGAQAFMTQNINGKPYYYSYMIVPRESPLAGGVEDLKSLKGMRIALGDPSSTSSSLIPRLALQRAGLDWQKDVTTVFTGGHDAVLAAVAADKADAGFLDSAIFEGSLAKKVPDQYVKVQVAWKSAELFQYPWAARAGLDPQLVKRIQASMKTVSDPEILAAFGASAFVEADDSKYEDVREAARAMGIDLKKENLATK